MLLRKQRNSTEFAARTLDLWFPTKADRSARFECLVQSLKAAHREGPDRWGLTLRLDNQRLRINVGPQEVLTLYAGDSWPLLVLTEEAVRDATREHRENVSPAGSYRKVKDAVPLTISPTVFSIVYNQYLDAHETVIRAAASSTKYYQWKEAHSPGVLRYLEQSLDLVLPDPLYSLSDQDFFGYERPVVDDETDRFFARNEGRIVLRQHRVRERDRTLVERAKLHAMQSPRGFDCRACGFSFEKTYGALGAQFAEFHHAVPLSEYSHDGEPTRVDTLVPVCANCHSMLHRRRPWLCVDDLALLIAKGD